jgi:hypothetical protein
MRAAVWPLECLDGFGNPDLNDLAQSVVGKRPHAKFEQEYHATIERERSHLWDRTRNDSQFNKALALSSLSAHARISSSATRLGGPRNRAMRLAESTLYRYLARAAGRSTPHGLWAGVTEVRFGDRTEVQTTTAPCRFAPDLRPFQTLVRGLAERPEYRYRASWRLNPTLRADPRGGWTFLGRQADGRIEKRFLEPDPIVSRALEGLAETPPMALDRLAADVARRESWPVASRRRLLHMFEALASGGALVGGMDLPAKFGTPWEALEDVSKQLGGKERAAWAAATLRLEDLCGNLSSDAVWAFSTDAFISRLVEVGDCVAALARALDLSPGVPATQVLRCDLHLPWRITLDGSQRDSLHTALVDYESQWLRGASPDAKMRELMRSSLARRLAGGRSLGESVELLAQEPRLSSEVWPHWEEVVEPGVRARLRLWETSLDKSQPEVSLAPSTESVASAVAPAGALFAGLSGDDGIFVRSVADIPTLGSARFGDVLNEPGLNRWIQDQLEQSIRDSGISLAELRIPFEPNPNVLASPVLLPDAIEPWGADADSLPLRGAVLDVDGSSGRPVLRLAGSDRPWAVLSMGAANLQAHDPVARLLLMTGFHESPGRNQRAVDVPVASELASRRFTPRILLRHGAVLRRRRSLLSGELAALAGARGIERFHAWQGLARELDWPEELLVSTGAGEAIRIHRDSPLAVEAAFKGIWPDSPYLVVEEAGVDRGLSIPGMGNHVAELAIPFAR